MAFEATDSAVYEPTAESAASQKFYDEIWSSSLFERNEVGSTTSLAGDDLLDFSPAIYGSDSQSIAQAVDQSDSSYPDAQEFSEMLENAGDGRLDRNAGIVFGHALSTQGMQGLQDTVEAFNNTLAEQGSEFRVDMAGLRDAQGQTSLLLALTKPDEDGPAIIRDLIQKGRESQYAERAIRIRIAPVPRPETPFVV